MDAEKHAQVIAMLDQGKSAAYISKVVGVSEHAIYYHKKKIYGPRVIDEKKNKTMDFDKECEWTEAVNRIRKYCNLKPFPMPVDRRYEKWIL